MSRVRGFTLVELLVTIAVIAVLVAALLPAINSARLAGVKTKELAASRSLMVAYLAYAEDNDTRVLLGSFDPTGFEDYTDEFGRPVRGETITRYPFRLAEYFSFEWEGVTHINEQADALAALRAEYGQSPPDLMWWQYEVSLYPSLGLNDQYVGGSTKDPVRYARGLHVSRLTDAARPGKLITFASACFTGADVFGNAQSTDGFFRIEPPKEDAWRGRDANDRDYFGYVHPRYAGEAVVGFFDGSSGTLTDAELTDRRYWSDPAARANDPDWDPSTAAR